MSDPSKKHFYVQWENSSCHGFTKYEAFHRNHAIWMHKAEYPFDRIKHIRTKPLSYRMVLKYLK